MYWAVVEPTRAGSGCIDGLVYRLLLLRRGHRAGGDGWLVRAGMFHVKHNFTLVNAPFPRFGQLASHGIKDMEPNQRISRASLCLGVLSKRRSRG